MAELKSGAPGVPLEGGQGRTTLDTVCHLYSEPGHTPLNQMAQDPPAVTFVPLWETH